ncbi:MAG: DUF3050 domain-containing protein [Planctomycetes bacterium]|nr:DUF3050 domain-containing protein [Planctomycetota bacterium]
MFDSLRQGLARHPLYGAIRSPADLRLFMAHHLVCVWDFMSLLKSLQRDLTTVTLPWRPAADPELTRLINEIVLDEESDQLPDGRVLSHFAWYREAMAELGADRGPGDRLLAALDRGVDPLLALEASGLPPAARAFGATTLALLDESTTVRAAVFLHGREDLIPEMFLPLVEGLVAGGLEARLLVGYLERHVAADRDEHGPRARRLLGRLVAADPGAAEATERAVQRALEARRDLWDAILAALPSRAASALGSTEEGRS